MNKIQVLFGICCMGIVLSSGARTFDVTTFGAKADGVTDNTAAIQKAIDQCTSAGGGTVFVPGGGIYKTYTLNLKNNVRLEIDRGATLLGGEDPLKYPEFGPNGFWNVERVPRFNKRALFYTVGQTNVAITGRGTIDGNADLFHEPVPNAGPGAPKFRRKSGTLITGRSAFFVACRDVELSDFLFYHPCGWCTWFLDCDRVRCNGVRIECHPQYPNGDGLHFGGCRDVVVSDCVIHAQDDAIIIRTHQEQMKKPRPCERIVINNCILSSNQSAIRFGWTEDYGIRDVSINNIVCTHSRLGVQFYFPPNNDTYHIDPPRDVKNGILPPPPETILPFFAENIHFSNLQITSDNAPFEINLADTEKVDYIRDISFSNCRFVSGCAPIFRIRPEDNVSRWRFSNIDFIIRKKALTHRPKNITGFFENCDDISFDSVRWSFR